MFWFPDIMETEFFYDGKNIPLEHTRSSTIPTSDIVKRKTVRETMYSEVD